MSSYIHGVVFYKAAGWNIPRGIDWLGRHPRILAGRTVLNIEETTNTFRFRLSPIRIDVRYRMKIVSRLSDGTSNMAFVFGFYGSPPSGHGFIPINLPGL